MYTKRERKTAENKQSLLRSLLERIKTKEFGDIKISDLCNDASISQASFYNYFPRKTDLLVYFVQLWSLEVTWKVEYELRISGLDAIESVFCDTAKSILKHPEVMAEITSFQAKWKMTTRMPDLTVADKVLAYPAYVSVGSLPVTGLSSILTSQLKTAVRNGELPHETPIDVVLVMLDSIFFGSPMFLKQLTVDQITAFYREQLAIVWCGIRAKYQGV